MRIKIRSESDSDASDIEALIVSAFLDTPHTGHNEQFIVKALRQTGKLSVSLVAETNSEMVGHVAVSPIAISDGSRQWYGLGPISVLPKFQGQGIGSQLMEQALTELQKLGAAGCVVLGEPEYYGRFGFKVEPKLVLPDIPPEFFQAISFGSRVPAGTVSYHPVFNVQG